MADATTELRATFLALADELDREARELLRRSLLAENEERQLGHQFGAEAGALSRTARRIRAALSERAE